MTPDAIIYDTNHPHGIPFPAYANEIRLKAKIEALNEVLSEIDTRTNAYTKIELRLASLRLQLRIRLEGER